MVKKQKASCTTEIYSRVTGFYRPVEQWNPGKTEEFKDRETYEDTISGEGGGAQG